MIINRKYTGRTLIGKNAYADLISQCNDHVFWGCDAPLLSPDNYPLGTREPRSICSSYQKREPDLERRYRPRSCVLFGLRFGGWPNASTNLHQKNLSKAYKDVVRRFKFFSNIFFTKLSVV